MTRVLVQLLLLLLFLATTCASAAYPRFGFSRKSVMSGVSKRLEMSELDRPVDLLPEFVTNFYTQTLDHFNYRPESYSTFQQKYIINSQYWGGANTSSPIFVYTGDEGPITSAATILGFMVDLASRFKGLLLYIEHRYYGDSMPFGSVDEAFRNASTLGYCSSTQALADYAQLITDVKRNLSAESCPVIAIGGSYGGMLASWFRLKYPHIALGALASSAPILYFDDITPQNGYFAVASKDFMDTSESCYNTIRHSWFEIDRVAAEPNGLVNLSNIFRTCQPLNSSEELKESLERIYYIAAQYNMGPFKSVLLCNAMDGAPNGTDILGRVAAAFNATFGAAPCHSVHEYKPSNQDGWTWQTCTEMVMPIGCGDNDTMFQAQPFDINEVTKTCEDLFGITPRPHWATTEFGGHDIKSVLGNFASNIIFSNGLRDPYSSGGVLQNISDSVVAISTEEGSHCLDILTPDQTNDPDWLVSQRDQEIKIIEGWIAQYNLTLIN